VQSISEELAKVLVELAGNHLINLESVTVTWSPKSIIRIPITYLPVVQRLLSVDNSTHEAEAPNQSRGIQDSRQDQPSPFLQKSTRERKKERGLPNQPKTLVTLL
jgi:hypothetical protein